MNDQNVTIAVPRVLDGLPGADGDDVDRDPRLILDRGQNMILEPRIGGRCRRLHDDRAVPTDGGAGAEKGDESGLGQDRFHSLALCNDFSV